MALNRDLPGKLARLALLGVAAYYIVWGGEYSAFDLLRINRLHATEEVALASARAEVDSLRAVATSLEHDRKTIERVARERFGMIRTGELLYRFVEVEPDTAADLKVATSP